MTARQFPLLAYRVTPSARTVTVTVTLGLAAPVTEDLTWDPGEDLWGWGCEDTDGVPSADTLLSAFVAMLGTHSALSGIEGVYAVETSVRQPVWVLSLGAPLWTIEFDDDLPEMAIEAGDTITQVLGYPGPSYLRHWRGIWAPSVLGAHSEPVFVDDGQTTRNPYSPGVFDRLRVAQRMVWSTEWGYCDAADISRAILADGDAATYLALADRITSDRGSTLDDLIAAAGSGRQIRLVLGVGPTQSDEKGYQFDGSLLVDGEIRRDGLTREETVGGRRYRVVVSIMAATSGTIING